MGTYVIKKDDILSRHRGRDWKIVMKLVRMIKKDRACSNAIVREQESAYTLTFYHQAALPLAGEVNAWR
jgi:predicted SprT family Zn-dependent metalloprotease